MRWTSFVRFENWCSVLFVQSLAWVILQKGMALNMQSWYILPKTLQWWWQRKFVLQRGAGSECKSMPHLSCKTFFSYFAIRLYFELHCNIKSQWNNLTVVVIKWQSSWDVNTFACRLLLPQCKQCYGLSVWDLFVCATSTDKWPFSSD